MEAYLRLAYAAVLSRLRLSGVPIEENRKLFFYKKQIFQAYIRLVCVEMVGMDIYAV